MVKKKIQIGKKPTPPTTPNIDDWVETRGAKQQPEQAPAPDEKPEKMKRLTIDIPESLHRKFKGKAAVEGIKMADWMREKIEEWVGSD